MALTPRRIDLDRDYGDLASWWKFWKWEPVACPILPDIGYVVESPIHKVAAGFLYDSRPMAWMEWIVANPLAPKDVRAKSLDILIETIEAHAREIGIQFLFTGLKAPSLVTRLEKHEFITTDRNMIHMLKPLASRRK